MSRSGYTDELDQWQLIMYRGRVASALRGSRGQRFLRALIAALDAMPVKRLAQHDLQDADGQVCALGSALVARGLDIDAFDPYDHETLAGVFDVAPCLVAEVEYENDECITTPENRWHRMRQWAEHHLRPSPERRDG